MKASNETIAKQKGLGLTLNFLLPGLGNAYSRNVKKGILTYVLFLVILFSLRFVAYNFVLFVVWIALIVAFWFYSIISGYRDVQVDREYAPATFDKWYVYVLIIGFHWILFNPRNGPILDRLTPINFASIPTPSMDPGLLVGDLLAFRKTKSIERNDVTVFWFPRDSSTKYIEVNTMYIKRCIGLPGDSLEIRSGNVLIDGVQMEDRPLKFSYLVTTDGSQIHPRILEEIGQEGDRFMPSVGSYKFFLTKKQAEDLKEMKFLKEVKLSLADKGEYETTIYPISENHRWNTDFYGPVYIPKKGDRIELTEMNIDLYLKCIKFENELVEGDNTGLKINGQLATTYEFKENYFFMMGDSRHNSLDSRYWGLLPEKLVIGKAMYVWWSKSEDRIGKALQ